MKYQNAKRMPLIFSFLLAVCLCLLSTTAQAAPHTLHWYCVRNGDHKQPLHTEYQWIRDYGGYYVDQAHSDNHEEKVLYLTFDAGYENGNVEKILNVLKEENTPATFFVLEHLVLNNTPLIRRMLQEGHTVGNHTATHVDITKLESKELLQNELLRLEEAYFKALGEKMPKYFRPPEGSFSTTTMQWLHDLGYQTVFWSFAYDDWDNARQPDPQKAKQKIMDNLHNGAVLLLHPTSKTNAEILGDVIRDCRSLGYRFGTIDELVDASSS